MNNNSTNQTLLQTLLSQIKTRDELITSLTKENEVQLIRHKEKLKQYKKVIIFLIFILILSGISNILFLLH